MADTPNGGSGRRKWTPKSGRAADEEMRRRYGDGLPGQLPLWAGPAPGRESIGGNHHTPGGTMSEQPDEVQTAQPVEEQQADQVEQTGQGDGGAAAEQVVDGRDAGTEQAE
jgi:hypothetical protein